MKLWRVLRTVFVRNVRTLRSAPKSYNFLKKLFKSGGYEVVTHFRFQDRLFSYRTVVYADADICTYLPALPAEATQKNAFLSQAKHAYPQHLKKVRALLAVFTQNELFWKNMADYALVAVNLSTVGYTISETTSMSVSYAALTLTSSFLVRPWLRRRILEIVMKRAVSVLLKYSI